MSTFCELVFSAFGTDIRHDEITKAQDKILEILNCTSITNEVTDASHNPELPPRVLQQPLRPVPECLIFETSQTVGRLAATDYTRCQPADRLRCLRDQTNIPALVSNAAIKLGEAEP